MKRVNEMALKKLPLFSTISNDTMERFIKEVKINHLSKGDYIIRDKEITDFVYIVFSGKISVYKLSETGDKRIFFILNEGSILNDDLVNGLASAINCECFEDSVILIYDKKNFLKLMQGDFEFMKNILSEYSSKLRRTYRQLKNAPTNVTMEKKLAAKLYSLCRHYGIKTESGTLIDLPLSVVYLSQLVGAQRETVSRALKKLIEANLVEYDNKKFTIPDIKALGDYHKK